VAQVGREIEQQAAREGLHGLHPVLVPRTVPRTAPRTVTPKATPAPVAPATPQKRPARHFMLSLLPAGSR
jgi:hypothetical protein